MRLLNCLLTANRCYKTGTTIKPRGVMVHSTGANNPNLRRYVQPVSTTPGRAELLAQLGANKNGNDWNREGKWAQGKWIPLKVCVHGFIGKLADGSVAAVQTLPWNRRGWHAGDGTSGRSANDTHISFEICEDGLDDPAYACGRVRPGGWPDGGPGSDPKQSRNDHPLRCGVRQRPGTGAALQWAAFPGIPLRSASDRA